MNRFLELLKRARAANEPILLDGAMGTMLMAQGLIFGDPPDQWNILPEHQHKVRNVYKGYLDAGSQVILTNSFGGTSYRLKMHNLQDKVFEINQAAAALAREVAGERIVAGSMGPTGELFVPMGAMTYDGAVDAFAAQAEGLAAGGADVLWVETMSDRQPGAGDSRTGGVGFGRARRQLRQRAGRARSGDLCDAPRKSGDAADRQEQRRHADAD
jgi:methionine synthase I (cobalamin-dependent)